jgi:iron complex transport system ATP-binding protein
MIRALNISVVANGKKLLHNVSMEITPGLFTAVAGPNGAGKTTLLKVLSNESNHFQGEVYLNGRITQSYSVAELSKVRAVLPQSNTLQFSFDVRQIVEMGLFHRRKENPAKDQLIDEAMELTGVTEWQNRNYLTLSGGEQQRVQLARVLAQVWEKQPFSRYILLDEPTSNLDIARQQMIFGIVKQACDRNIGVLAVVHDLNHVALFADELYLLKDGEMVASGKPREVFTKSIIEQTFCCRVNIYHDPCNDCPYIVPERENRISTVI